MLFDIQTNYFGSEAGMWTLYFHMSHSYWSSKMLVNFPTNDTVEKGENKMLTGTDARKWQPTYGHLHVLRSVMF